MTDRLLMERIYETADLIARFPAEAHHAHKKMLRDLAYENRAPSKQQLHVSRWSEGSGPVVATTRTQPQVIIRADPFVYEAALRDEVHWHVNYADRHLFGFHAGPLFAQDEMQVAEHPVLASVRDALIADGFPAFTEERGDSGPRATPILVAGAERLLDIDTAPRASAPQGLYGNRFARAPLEVVREAVTVLDTPSVSNIAAMAAPSGGRGRYSRAEMTRILATATTTFSAARAVSERFHGAAARVVMHSGFWGCGAFGGHRVLMPALQILAASIAGVHRLDLHALGVGGVRVMSEAALLGTELLQSGDTDAWIERLDGLEFHWGTSDGH